MIFSIIFSSQLVLSIGSFGWGPLAPFLKSLLSLSNTQLGAVSTSFYFASALSAFPAGIAVDHYGVKKGLLSWLILTGLPLLLLSFVVHNYYIFLILAGFSGLGYGIGNPVASKALFIWFDKKIRGTVFGMRQSAVTIGAAIAGVLLVYMSQRNGPLIALRTVFWMILVVTIPVFFLYQNPEKLKDVSGRIRLEFIDLFNDNALFILSLVAAMFGMAQGVVASFFLLYLNEGLGYSLIAAGSLFAIVTISGAAGRIFWGVVSDRLFAGNRKPVLIIISSLAFLSVVALALLPKISAQVSLIVVAIGIGLSSWGWNGITFLMVAEISVNTRTAASVGLATTFGWFGLSLGPVGFGILTDKTGYFHAWISLAVFCVLAVLLSFFLTNSGSCVTSRRLRR